MRAKLRSVVVLIALLLVSGGCGGGSITNAEDALTPADAEQEYNQAMTEWPPPPGTSYEPLKLEENGVSILYSPGQPESFLQARWLCAWEDEWLTSRGESDSRETAALTQLERLPTSTMYQQRWDDVSRDLLTKALAAARLGDPVPIRNDFLANC